MEPCGGSGKPGWEEILPVGGLGKEGSPCLEPVDVAGPVDPCGPLHDPPKVIAESILNAPGFELPEPVMEPASLLPT